jgi:heptosyltransferase-2
MMQAPGRILVFQTAFTGDVILTLPMVQALHKLLPDVVIDFVTVPSSAQALANHPAVNHIIEYDKKGKDMGIAAAIRLARSLRKTKYDAAIVPHRSLRSAAICCHAGIPRRIGFATSAGRWFFSDEVPYDARSHEIQRNLQLLQPLGYRSTMNELPNLYPSPTDGEVVDAMLGWRTGETIVALAPGSVWATKRWLEERFIAVTRRLLNDGLHVALIGGRDDEALGERMEERIASERVINAMGKLSLLQSAELIRRCRVLVCNDSAPMHLAVAMRTPVVAIFGATVPEFGFAPLGERDVVVETKGLHCRPCGIHGGKVCPTRTFDCMKLVRTEQVLQRVYAIINSPSFEPA